MHPFSNWRDEIQESTFSEMWLCGKWRKKIGRRKTNEFLSFGLTKSRPQIIETIKNKVPGEKNKPFLLPVTKKKCLKWIRFLLPSLFYFTMKRNSLLKLTYLIPAFSRWLNLIVKALNWNPILSNKSSSWQLGHNVTLNAFLSASISDQNLPLPVPP